MGELVMTKNEGRLDFLDESIRFMVEGGGILKAEEFVAKEQQAHPGMDTTSCYHKIVMARYFGLVLFNNYSSYYFLTESGTVYSRATSKESKIDAILKALTSVTFGRNNNAVNSNSDIEAPVVMLKAISLMGAASMTQIGLILYYMDAHGKTLAEAIDEVNACEDQSGLRIKLTENQNSKYFDVKFNKLFFELGIVEKEQSNYVLSKYVKDKHLDFINALPELKPIISKERNNVEITGTEVLDEYVAEVSIVDSINNNLTVNDLGQILAEMYNNASARNQSNAIRMFGIKYGGVITENNYSASGVVKASGINASYDAEVSKGISIYKSIKVNEYGIRFVGEDAETSDVNDTKVLGGFNKIYYGAPGCGKSFTVNKMLNDANVPEANRIRVTFHPEYANCDFVGQILPAIEKEVDPITGKEVEKVTYVERPGPFTLALKRARETNDMVYLIIEEINRGNAAAIFGDLFQLLDRVKDTNKSNWGESEYPVCNGIIQRCLNADENESIVIPSNLTILATMNTSDQSVFALDTAFKRRWSFEQISNNIKKDTDHKYKHWYVPGTKITLETFLTVVNEEILKHKITSEDKRMGKYFISRDCLTDAPCEVQDVKDQAKMFAYKVLEYIWNDVCKIGKDEWFDTISIKTLEDLIDAFVEPEAGADPLSVFKSITF